METVQPAASTRRSTVSVEETLAPDSIHPTVDLGTPARSASSACVRPERRRASRTMFAIDMVNTIANWLSDVATAGPRPSLVPLPHDPRSSDDFGPITRTYALHCICTTNRRRSVCNRSNPAPATTSKPLELHGSGGFFFSRRPGGTLHVSFSVGGGNFVVFYRGAARFFTIAAKSSRKRENTSSSADLCSRVAIPCFCRAEPTAYTKEEASVRRT